MKILFIIPPGTMEDEYGELKDAGSLYPSLGIASIAAIALQENHVVQVLDAEALKIDITEIKRRVKNFAPDLVGMQAFFTTQNKVIALAEMVKSLSSSIIVVVGGVHMTLFKEEFMENLSIDYGVYGEGDIIFRNLLRALEQRITLEGIKGLIWRKENEIITNPPQPLIRNLDDLPTPALHLFPLDQYHSSAQLRGHNTLHIMTSRGCPYRCVYCSSNQIFGKTHRYFSTKRVLNEIHYMIDNFGVDGIQFYDEVFTLNRKRAMNLCQALIDDGRPLEWTCFTRVNLVDQELLEKMAEAGCYQIFYGLESGVQRLLDLVQKDITLEQSRKAIAETRNAGIESVASFILTLPTETKEDTEKTIQFAIDVDPDYVYWLTCIPYPGTGLYELALQNGTILEKDFAHYNVFNEIVYLPEGREVKEIEKTIKKAYKRFYFRPKYIFRRLRGLNKLPPWKLWYLLKSGLRMFY